MMTRRQKAIARRRARRGLGAQGTAAVEFALTAPLLAVLVLGVTDYGILMNKSAALVGATRVGAEYAISSPTDTTGIQNQVTGFMSFSPALKTFNCLAGNSCIRLSCTCVDNSTPGPLPTCPAPDAANPCAAANGGSGITNPYTNNIDNRVLRYVTVTAAQNFSPAFTVTNFPGLSSTTFFFPPSLSATTVARAQ
jgi:Flp pilus assembly protein TadG